MYGVHCRYGNVCTGSLSTVLRIRIQKQQQKREVQKFCCHTFFVAINFTNVMGSGIRTKPIPELGSRGHNGKGSRIPDPDPQHWLSIARPIYGTSFHRYRTVPNLQDGYIINCIQFGMREKVANLLRTPLG